MHEIVTVQLGRRANYLCTHYWNAQESYQTFGPGPPSLVNHDIHFRPGLAPDGTESYLPRTLIYDYKNGFGSLAEANVLNASDATETNSEVLWNGALNRMPPAPRADPSPYTMSLLGSLEPVLPTISTTPFFADFASTFYHPRSVIPVALPYPTRFSTQPEPTSFAISGAQSSAFEAGVDLFSVRDAEFDVLDTDLRPWLEECDGLQAVQIFASTDDSWAGFTAKYVERMRDELGKGCIWAWGLDNSLTVQEPGNTKPNRLQRDDSLITQLLLLHGLAEHASMFVPLAVPQVLPANIRMNRQSLWHTSAFLESAIESSTLATRLRSTVDAGHTLKDWQDLLSEGGRRTIAKLGFNTGFDKQWTPKDSRIRPGSDDDDDGISKTLAKRHGISLAPFDAAPSTKTSARPRSGKTFSRIESFRGPQEAADRALLAVMSSEKEKFEVYSTPIEFPLLPTYPKIYLDAHGSSSEVLEFQTALETSSDIARWIRSLQTALRYASRGSIDGEEREAVYDNLGAVAEKYIEDWESDDESEEDI